MIFYSNVLKRWSFQKKIALKYGGSCIIWKDCVFLPENKVFFLWTENER